MPPKKQKTRSNNIRDYFKNIDPNRRSPRPGGASLSRMSLVGSEATGSRPSEATGSRPSEATGSRPSEATGSRPSEAKQSRTVNHSQMELKENIGDSMDGHSHKFTVRCLPNREEYTITCGKPGTVLEAIKSSETYEELMFKDKSIVIQLGKEVEEVTVATHFPCSFISEGESLFITCESDKVEVAQDQHDKTVYPRDNYSVFYIDTTGGLHTKTKKLFMSSAVKHFKYLCVYALKGTTVEDALQRDGRFIENLRNFKLSHNDKPDLFTKSTATVDNLNEKKLKINLPRGALDSHQRHDTNTQPYRLVSTSKTDVGTTAVLNLLKQRGTSVRAAVANKDNNVNIEEIYEILRQQFPDLKKQMERRFPGDSYQKALSLRKEDFGKIQHSFSEVHRVKKLFKLGESVCKVIVGNVSVGTGFVLFDNFILTNAHLLKDCVEGGKLKEGIEVYALFNYEDPEPHSQCYYFQLAHGDICYSQGELDYAILEINPEGRKLNSTTPTKPIKVPPGLLKKFGPLPPNGEACLIGHPKGGLKMMDPICIIETEQRRQAVSDYLHTYSDTLFTLCSISHLIKKHGIDNIMMDGNKADRVATYNSFMYHGSSGSPVFDARCRVFGLHTSGYVYGFPNLEESVMETAQPLLTIFKDFVRQLRESGNGDLLKRVEEEAKGNSDLKKVLDATSTDEHTDTDEPMTY